MPEIGGFGAHAPTHEKDGADEIDATGLTGIPTPNVKHLTYNGNGAEIRAITGVGFQPKMVFTYGVTGAPDAIKAVGTGGAHTQLWDQSISSWRMAYETERILSLDPDGFTIEQLRNEVGYVYNVLCYG